MGEVCSCAGKTFCNNILSDIDNDNINKIRKDPNILLFMIQLNTKILPKQNEMRHTIHNAKRGLIQSPSIHLLSRVKIYPCQPRS